ncbi:MAG: RNA polymerase sigma factor [Acidimicrobiales bacterium]
MDHRSRLRPTAGPGQRSRALPRLIRRSHYRRPIVPAISDEALVVAALEGDEKALDALLRRHHDRIYALCRRLAGNDADAADATQEAMITVVRRLDRYDGRARFTTWLYRVVTNACLDELRRRKRRPVPMTDDGLTFDRAPSAPSLDGAVADRLDIDRALAQLAPEFRAPVVLRDLCGLDYAEIGEVLDLPPGTVRSRISRGRGALAHVLAGNPTPSVERPTPEPS